MWIRFEAQQVRGIAAAAQQIWTATGIEPGSKQSNELLDQHSLLEIAVSSRRNRAVTVMQSFALKI